MIVKKLKIEDMQALAGKLDGECLSTRYVSVDTKLKWKCDKGHEWETTPYSVKNLGTWCPICGVEKRASKRRSGIEEMEKLARIRGGRCLSKAYKNNMTKLKWKCKYGHVWEAIPLSIKHHGTWCPVCGRKARSDKKRLTLADVKLLAKGNGGKCLSKEYLDTRTKLKWGCSKGHEWEATPNNIQQGKWCPICGGSKRLTIAEMREIAKMRGGECLSKGYINAHSHLRWGCSKGHEWEASPYSIKHLKTWCPECNSQGVAEGLCRDIFHKLFGKHFPRKKPKWLKFKNSRLELDGYCEELGLAFEYQGEQHYKKHEFFHVKRSLKKQKEADKEKKELCLKHGIILIEIPYKIKNEDLKRFIVKECKSRGISIQGEL